MFESMKNKIIDTFLTSWRCSLQKESNKIDKIMKKSMKIKVSTLNSNHGGRPTPPVIFSRRRWCQMTQKSPTMLNLIGIPSAVAGDGRKAPTL